MNKDIRKMLDKPILNSYYPPASSEYFMLYDSNTDAKIIKSGQEILNKMNNFAKFEKRKRIIDKILGKNLDN